MNCDILFYRESEGAVVEETRIEIFGPVGNLPLCKPSLKESISGIVSCCIVSRSLRMREEAYDQDARVTEREPDGTSNNHSV